MLSFEEDPNFTAIAVTGADVGGKSKFMERARKYLDGNGNFLVAVQSEVASELIANGFHPVLGWKDELVFQRYLLEYMHYREQMYYRMLAEQDASKHRVLLCDRGALDSIAYIGREKFESLLESIGQDPHHWRERYKAVVHLVTAADGAEDVYMRERYNNPGRIIRPPEEARELDRKTQDAWHGHPHHIVVGNETDFETKVNKALNGLRRVLPMPLPREQERKFVVVRSSKPLTAVPVKIVQTYLTSSDPQVVRRVRAKYAGNSVTYKYTEKTETGKIDERIEIEETIGAARYEELLKEKEPGTQSINKLRYTYVHGGKTFEHDYYLNIIPTVEIIEVENCPMGEPISFFSGLVTHEVTTDNRFSNYSIAQGKFPGDEHLRIQALY
jgi:CYTH domain-containing protein